MTPKYSAKDLCFHLSLEDVLGLVLFCSVQCDQRAQRKTAAMSESDGACTAPVLLGEVHTWEYRSVKHPVGLHSCKGHRVHSAGLSEPSCCQRAWCVPGEWRVNIHCASLVLRNGYGVLVQSCPQACMAVLGYLWQRAVGCVVYLGPVAHR